jgi:hypothetical protein
MERSKVEGELRWSSLLPTGKAAEILVAVAQAVSDASRANLPSSKVDVPQVFDARKAFTAFRGVPLILSSNKVLEDIRLSS